MTIPLATAYTGQAIMIESRVLSVRVQVQDAHPQSRQLLFTNKLSFSRHSRPRHRAATARPRTTQIRAKSFFPNYLTANSFVFNTDVVIATRKPLIPKIDAFENEGTADFSPQHADPSRTPPDHADLSRLFSRTAQTPSPGSTDLQNDGRKSYKVVTMRITCSSRPACAFR